MKRNKITILTALMLALILIVCGCGGGSSKDKNELVTYESASGLTLQMKKGLKEGELEGFACFFEGTDCIMSAVREGFELYEELGYDAKAITIDDYAAMVKSANALSDDFAADSYGNPYVTYVKTIENNEYFYYTTLRKSEDAFWVISFACFSKQQSEFLPQFEAWGNSITIK